MDISVYSILIWTTALVAAVLNLVVYIGSKKLSSRAFTFMMTWAVFWMAEIGLTTSISNTSLATATIKSSYVIGAIIAASFFYFCLTFPEDKKPKRWIAPLLILAQAIMAVLFYSDLAVHSFFKEGSAVYWSWHYGSLYFIFDIFFFGFFAAGLIVLYRKFWKSPAGKMKTHLKYMFWAMLVAVTPPGFFNIFLPRMGYFDLNWLGPITGIGWMLVLTYSIVKYRQMNVKVVASEVFILVMIAILFFNIFVSDITLGIIGRIVIFLAFTLVGYVYIRGIFREVRQKEELEVLTIRLKYLNENLQDKVDVQTQELQQKVNELEKFYQLTVGRELKMVELKKKIKELE